jgi:diguanylate cyclase (GGDEF)-like protein
LVIFLGIVPAFSQYVATARGSRRHQMVTLPHRRLTSQLRIIAFSCLVLSAVTLAGLALGVRTFDVSPLTGRIGLIATTFAVVFGASLIARIAVLSNRLDRDLAHEQQHTLRLFQALEGRNNEIEIVNDQLREVNAEILHRSRHDDLTGVLNRRAFLDQLQAVATEGAPLCVAVVDVDHFKSVNDTYGHHIGDAVLQAVVTMLTSSLGASCIVGRLGGEEFGVLFPSAGEAIAACLLEGAARDLRQKSLLPEPDAAVTISAGVSEFTVPVSHQSGPVSSEALVNLLRSADLALYRAKRSGRDRVEIASQNPAVTPVPPPTIRRSFDRRAP